MTMRISRDNNTAISKGDVEMNAAVFYESEEGNAVISNRTKSVHAHK